MKLKSSTKLRLLPKHALIKTGPVDHADWNYQPVLGWIIRKRYEMALPLLQQQPIQRLLKIGYGSGVFLPQLAQCCEALYGIDIHPKAKHVTQVLANYGVKANLQTASAVDLPFDDLFFDCVVIISALEFIDNLEAVCSEVKRVLRPDGFLLVVTPGQSKILDIGLKLLTGESARKDFGNRRNKIIPTLYQHFNVVYEESFPKWKNSWLSFYTTLKLYPLEQKISNQTGASNLHRKKPDPKQASTFGGTNHPSRNAD